MHEPRLLHDVARELDEAGLRASIMVRDLDSGDELGLEADAVLPAASLAKLPLALAVLHQIEHGSLDAADLVEVSPGTASSPGIGRFRHPAAVSVVDLVSLALTISDDAAADALLELVEPSQVMAFLDGVGIQGLTIRRPFGDLWETPLERLHPGEGHLAHTLAIRGSTPAQGHPVHQLDIGRANTGTARAWADLLQAVWLERGISARVAEQLRSHLHHNVLRQRLAPDFAADDTRWASKTGTVLNQRHEVGVVEHADGSRFAVAALSVSRVPATEQPAADAALGAAARRLHDAVRDHHA